MENKAECCCDRKRVRTEEELRALKNRLKRIEGQIRGISGMLESDAYCIDILTQVSAAQAAISSFSKELLSQHIRTCVADELKNGNQASVDELVGAVERLMR